MPSAFRRYKLITDGTPTGTGSSAPSIGNNHFQRLVVGSYYSQQRYRWHFISCGLSTAEDFLLWETHINGYELLLNFIYDRVDGTPSISETNDLVAGGCRRFLFFFKKNFVCYRQAVSISSARFFYI